ncbi:hypothetical protein HPB48_011167 [Haemaphysalis longicornis]|uniref:Uncharacterized protein n=1 Tax=Haemaphysalis longicornis TaxID=44386 RepID=A0A9J6GX35_HAELO|nr:hypothetical protein HPB48_011167 [Haemaphysalis longicornis]
MSGLEQMSVVDGRGANRGRKRLIVHVGLGVIVLLLIIDIVLLVLFFTAKSKNTGKATMAAARRRLRHTGGVVNRADDDEAYILLEDVSPSPLNTTFRRQTEILCNTSGCVWLQGYLRPLGSVDGEGLYRSVRAAGPCDDFHEHVCGKQRHSVYRDGVARLMNAVRDKVVGQSEVGLVTRGGQESTGRGSNAEQESKLNYGGVLKRCLKGEAVVTMDDVFRACVDTDDGTCPKSLPDVPLRITEDYFRENPYASVTDYASFIERIAPNVHLNQATHLDAAAGPNASSRSPLTRACRWVAQSARCHFQQNRRLKSSSELDLYLLIWKVLYFAPLLGNQFGELLVLAYKQPPDAHLQACLRIGEDVFSRETVEMVRAVLAEAVPSVNDRVLNFIWEAREASSVPNTARSLQQS